MKKLNIIGLASVALVMLVTGCDNDQSNICKEISEETPCNENSLCRWEDGKCVAKPIKDANSDAEKLQEDKKKAEEELAQKEQELQQVQQTPTFAGACRLKLDKSKTLEEMCANRLFDDKGALKTFKDDNEKKSACELGKVCKHQELAAAKCTTATLIDKKTICDVAAHAAGADLAASCQKLQIKKGTNTFNLCKNGNIKAKAADGNAFVVLGEGAAYPTTAEACKINDKDACSEAFNAESASDQKQETCEGYKLNNPAAAEIGNITRVVWGKAPVCSFTPEVKEACLVDETYKDTCSSITDQAKCKDHCEWVGGKPAESANASADSSKNGDAQK